MVNSLLIRCFTAALCLGTLASAQQAGAIRGTVFDKDFDAPLAAVKVLLVETGVASSRGDARRSIEGGGVYLNNVRVESVDDAVSVGAALHGFEYQLGVG